MEEPTEPDEPELNELNQHEKLAEYFEDLQRYCMPFGRYGPDNFPPAGKPVHEVPLEYLVWFKEKGGGFPRGRLGELMQFVWEVKSVGAEIIFEPFRKRR